MMWMYFLVIPPERNQYSVENSWLYLGLENLQISQYILLLQNNKDISKLSMNKLKISIQWSSIAIL